MCGAQVVASLLQAIGKPVVPVTNILIVSVVKIISNHTLVAIPEVGINGAAISNIIMYALLFILNYGALIWITKIKPDVVSVYIKPLLGGAVCGLVAIGSYMLISSIVQSRLVIIVSIALAAVAYVLFILFSKTIKREDVEFLPKAKKIEKILEKRNWIR